MGREERSERSDNAAENRAGRMGEQRERMGDRDRDRTRMGDRDRDRRIGERDRDRDRLSTRERDRFSTRERERARGEVREGRELREGRDVREHGRVTTSTTRLSSDQRTRIHERLFAEGSRAHRLGHVDFALRRGVHVPRTVEFFDLPEDIVTLVPRFRHYKYFLVGDEIVIVDPVTYVIVDVIPA
jgi:hypothetical protein